MTSRFSRATQNLLIGKPSRDTEFTANGFLLGFQAAFLIEGLVQLHPLQILVSLIFGGFALYRLCNLASQAENGRTP